jgi:hypothetical protein
MRKMVRLERGKVEVLMLLNGKGNGSLEGKLLRRRRCLGMEEERHDEHTDRKRSLYKSLLSFWDISWRRSLGS